MGLPHNYIKLILGLKVKQLRSEKGMLLSELADRCGMSVSYLNEIESGKKYPKSDKILSLASALGADYDKLVSLKLTKQLAPIGELFESNILEQLPLDHYGIDLNKFIVLMSSASMQLSALVATIIDLANSSELSENNFSRTALRTYKEFNDNYFENIETSADDFCSEFSLEDKPPVNYNRLTEVLRNKYNYEIDETSISKITELNKLRAYVKQSNRQSILYLNSRLSPPQKTFIAGKELAYNYLKLKERTFTYSSLKLENFDHLLNNFIASYFSNALILNKKWFVKDILKFFGSRRWKPDEFINLIEKYNTSPEMFFQRLSSLAPKYLGLNKYFFIRFNSRTDSEDYYLSKEVRMNIRRNPGGYQSSEHYCRRWISIDNLKTLKKDLSVNPESKQRAGVIHSNFFNSKDEFLALSVAKASRFIPGNLYSVTIGFLIDDKLKSKIKFLGDKSIRYQAVNDTCETCGLSDCRERVAPPITLERNQQLQNLKKAISKLE